MQHATASTERLSARLSEWVPSNEHIANALREYICDAALSHTGADPTQDHGHTQCMWIGRAIQRLSDQPSGRLKQEAHDATGSLTEPQTHCVLGALAQLAPAEVLKAISSSVKAGYGSTCRCNGTGQVLTPPDPHYRVWVKCPDCSTSETAEQATHWGQAVTIEPDQATSSTAT
jgi:hypothetical protein